MSEKKGPFNAAIATLENNRCAFNKKAQVEITNAIRVLEAAEKVDKAHCLDKLDFLRRMAGEDKFGFVRYREDGLAIFPTTQIRALLDSLPEKEKKG